MLTPKPWFERRFDLPTDPGLQATLIERLDGTEYRLIAKLSEPDDYDGSAKPDGKWSIKEHVGHLLLLEKLWIRRARDIVQGKEYLTEADLENTATEKGNFNSYQIEGLIDDFGEAREEFMGLLRYAKPEDLQKTALHPRLKTPMNLIQLGTFVAEHDDHHLAHITALMNLY